MLDACSETCGLIAGVVGALSFGSFGVPIKFITNVKVDPLVMQVSHRAEGWDVYVVKMDRSHAGDTSGDFVRWIDFLCNY